MTTLNCVGLELGRFSPLPPDPSNQKLWTWLWGALESGKQAALKSVQSGLVCLWDTALVFGSFSWPSAAIAGLAVDQSLQRLMHPLPPPRDRFGWDYPAHYLINTEPCAAYVLWVKFFETVFLVILTLVIHCDSRPASIPPSSSVVFFFVLFLFILLIYLFTSQMLSTFPDPPP